MGLTSHNWGYAMSSNDTNQGSNKQARDGFFVISMEAWEKLLKGSLKHKEADMVRAMAAYLILACGSGGDHITTSWSAGAIYKYTGISKDPANRGLRLIEHIELIKVIKAPEKNKRPIYKINFFDKNPKEQTTDSIFIPNGVVTGVNGEDSPLKRLVQYQDPYILYLFIRLYGFQNKYLDVIDPSIVSSVINDSNELDAEQVYSEKGLLKVWAISTDIILSGYSTSPLYNFKAHDDDRFYCERTENDFIFGFLNILQGLGLMKTVTYACNGEQSGDVSEIDFICETDTKLQHNTFDYISEMAELKHCNFGDELDFYTHKVAIPPNYRKVHFQQFYQLRYRTKLGEARNRYSEERSIYQTISKNMKRIESSQ